MLLKPHRASELAEFTEHASKLAKIIREWLPVQGEATEKNHNWKTADSWFNLAADHYKQCERIRNPDGLPFDQRGGSYHGPADAGPYWLEACYALDAIATVYRWQGLSDGSGVPCSFAWKGPIPDIDGNLLKRLETAAKGLQSVVDELASLVTGTVGTNGIAAAGRPKGTFAIATDDVPDAYKEQGRECGPLEGTKTMLARVVTKNQKAKPDDLEKHHGGKVFVRQIQPRKLEVFFRSFKEFNAAKDQLTSDNSE
jgi:hypothetical protein